VSGIADPFSGHIDEFRIPHIQRSDGWIEHRGHRDSTEARPARLVAVFARGRWRCDDEAAVASRP
jgi:hypothetical protein